MHRTLLLVGSVLLCPTSALADGTVVGHPVPLHFAPGTGLTFTSGDITVTDEIVEFCSAAPQVIEVDETLDVFDPDTRLLLPVGTICAITLETGGTPSHLEGTGNGGTFALTLQHAYIHIDVYPPLVVHSDGTSIADSVQLAEPDWATVEILDIDPDEDVVIGPGIPPHGHLRASLRDDSTLLQ